MSDERANIRRSTLGSAVFPRRLKIYFYTSNLEKLLQARLLFRGQGQSLSHFRAHREPYEEDYSLGKEDLLRKAIAQVRNQFLVRSVFFVEDTSIRIDALSENGDYPGLRAKEWFSETSFHELDALLKSKGNNRRVTVKSDIALHIPNLEEVFLFHGETRGSVAKDPPTFEANPQHPWLTPATFNGWLVPEGAKLPLGAMSFENSAEHDFRGKAIGGLLSFLRPLNAAANLPSSFFTKDRGSFEPRKAEPYLPHIFDLVEDDAPMVFCIIGHKCSGKTTASEFIQSDFGGVLFEASEHLRATARDLGVEISSSNAALEFLARHGQDIVARQIIDQLSGDALPVMTLAV